MDSQRFDELARRLGGGTSRRGVLKGIAAGLGASVFGLSLRNQASAQTSCASGEDCDDDEICYAGLCIPEEVCQETGQSCLTAPCCSDECVDSVCTAVPVCGGESDLCEGDGSCCEGLICASGYCIYPQPTCAGYNEACSFPEVTVAASLDGSNCCEGYCLEGICVPACVGDGGACKDDYDCCDGYACSDKYTCEAIPVCGGHKVGCKDDYDCCDGLICSDKYICEPAKGVCGAPGALCEMVEDHGCCAGLTCFEGQCDNPSGLCMDEWEYCDGKYITCCKGLVCGDDYYCHAKKHDDKPHEPAKPPAAKPQSGPAVTTLPSTGSGTGDDNASWINAAALGGAAAVIGGALLKKKHEETASEEQ